MSEKDTGGPAFPCDANTARAWACFEHARKPLAEDDYIALIQQLQTGLNMRDYFAGQALIATYMNGFSGPDESTRAKLCYKMADAMLKERNAK